MFYSEILKNREFVKEVSIRNYETFN